ncbi:MAG: phenylalanine--tRNA ligase subunit beta [Deltaproteobacteria bacterium]|nr:phenylalanine--tRNA ligase subunit beta [Deltaproteobacteria bacterium]
MKIVHGWLQQLVDGELPEANALAELLTNVGLEVEEIERPGEGLRGMIVGEVLSVERHPDADKLSVCQVSDGSGTQTVVCGAPNVRAGMRVAFATPGVTLPGGLEIGARKVRGVPSAGMLCSAKELGLGDDHSGIMDLAADAKIGGSLAAALGMDDVVYTLGITPNRPDALSHLGVARDVAAVLGVPLLSPSSVVPEAGQGAAELTRIEIEAPEGCRRYAARIIEGLKMGPSPAWMQARLQLCGVRPISNVVDVTNYVLMELGHPLHAFDLDHLHEERIRVRWAGEGERFTTLDGVERVLDPADLLIGDADRGVALAGVMGGELSEVRDSTTRVLLESAHFEATVIRRTARRHGLHTEASHRFERGADPLMVPVAADRAAALFAELAGGEVAPGLVDTQARPYELQRVTLRHGRVEQVLGTPVSLERQHEILGRLGFEFAETKEDRTELLAPSFRTEMSREIDLIEEIARIEGYGIIPSLLPPQDRPMAAIEAHDPTSAVLRRLREAALAADASEVVNYSFLAPELVAALDGARQPIRITNPLSSEQSVMRTMVSQSLLTNLLLNRRFLAERVRLFELGRAYLPASAPGESTREPERFAVLFWGPRSERGWSVEEAASDFYDLKGVLEAAARLLAVARLEVVAAAEAHPWLHPRTAASVLLGGEAIGWMGELHPRIAGELDLPRGVMLLEVDVKPLAAAAHLLASAPSLPRFPPLLRDLAVVVDEALPAASLLALLRAPLPAAEELGVRIEDVRLFDVYAGEQVGEGKRSLAFSLKFLAPDRTLKDEEADALQAALLERLQAEAGALLRG